MLRRFRTGLWANPDFVRLWAGTTVSQFGTFIGGLALQFTAIIWLDATAAEIAILSACQLVPGFLLGPLAGVWVDRLPRRPLLIAADIGRAAGLASIPLAALFDLLTMGHLWLAGVALSSLTVLFDTAYRAYLPALVGRTELLEGNSKLAASSSVAEIGGFSLSGFLVQALTAPGAVLVDAVSFLWSALWIGRIRAPEVAAVSVDERTSVWREAVEGAGYVWRQPILRSLAGATVILNAGSRIIGVVFLLYLAEEVGFDPAVLGVIFAVGGFTSIAGAVVAHRSWFGGLGPSLIVSIVIRCLGALFMPLAKSTSALSASYLVANQVVTDPAWLYYEVNETTLRQSITPDRYQGRMNATMRVLEFGAMLIGTALGGVLGELIGLRATLWVAIAIMASAAPWLAFTAAGRIRTTPAPAE
ncbi:MAG: MFS transporter [Dehalococcoidia bacterium]